jgi:F420-0:gamma-glutamyl ligase-like protein
MLEVEQEGLQMDINSLNPNEGKNLVIDTKYGGYARYPVKTHLIMKEDKLDKILGEYVQPFLEPGDMICISEKVVAITQGRALPISEIKVSRAANFLYKFVHKSPYGIGLGSPWTMELAIRDIGLPLILFAAFCSAVTKLFGIRGVFYKIVGTRGRAIDGPCDCTIPPYNQYAKFAPENPDKVAGELKESVGHEVIVIDSNDLGCDVLGKSSEDVDVSLVKEIFADNPLGQSCEQTPIAIVRKVVTGD